ELCVAGAGSGSLGHHRVHSRLATDATGAGGYVCDADCIANFRRAKVVNTAFAAPPGVARLQQRALSIGVLFAVIFLVGIFFDRATFWRAYLIGYLFWTGIALGSLALLMLQHLTGGGWGLGIRRVLEAATRTLPVMAVLCIPIIIGSASIYPWRQPEAATELGAKATLFLNLRFFIVRAVVYFAIWLVLTYFLNAWSQSQDRTASREFGKKMRLLSGPGLVLFVLTVTFAAIDWVMSMSPEWSSTIFGLLFVAAFALGALAFVVAAMALLSRTEPMSEVVAPLHFHDLGKLLLALVMLWAYFAFSQYLIIWSGNLPEEIQWYLPRTRGAWGGIALAVVILHFAVPFLFLLSRRLKRNPNKLVLVAVFILIMRYVDLLWVVAPNFSHEAFHVSWMDLVSPVGFGGVWLATFFWQLRQRPVMPINDPQFPSVLEQAHSQHGDEFIDETA